MTHDERRTAEQPLALGCELLGIDEQQSPAGPWLRSLVAGLPPSGSARRPHAVDVTASHAATNTEAGNASRASASIERRSMTSSTVRRFAPHLLVARQAGAKIGAAPFHATDVRALERLAIVGAPVAGR